MKKIALIIPVAMLVLMASLFFPSEAKAAACAAPFNVIDPGTTVGFGYRCTITEVVQTGFWPWETTTYQTRESHSSKLPLIYSSGAFKSKYQNIVVYTYDKKEAKKNNTYLLRSNGCTDPTPLHLKEIFKAACNEHDYCYATLGVSKKTCDSAFLGNLLFICDKLSPLDPLNAPACIGNATIMYAAVDGKGQAGYDFQQNLTDDYGYE